MSAYPELLCELWLARMLAMRELAGRVRRGLGDLWSPSQSAVAGSAGRMDHFNADNSFLSASTFFSWRLTAWRSLTMRSAYFGALVCSSGRGGGAPFA